MVRNAVAEKVDGVLRIKRVRYHRESGDAEWDEGGEKRGRSLENGGDVMGSRDHET